MMKNKILYGLLFSSLFLNAQVLDLNDLIDLTIKNNPNIKITKSNTNEKKANVQQSKAAYLPQVNLNGNVSGYEIETTNAIIKDHDVNTYGATLDQLIFDFGKTTSTINATQSDYEASLKKEIQIISQSIFDTKKAFYDILGKNQLINVAQESYEIDQLQLEQANAYFKAGIKTKIDVTNAKLNLSSSKLGLIRSKYQLKLSIAKLITILGEQKEFEIKTEDTDIFSLVNNKITIDKSLEMLIEKGLENRSEISVFNNLIKAQRENISSKEAQYLPSLKLQASYNDTNSDNITSIDQAQSIVGVYLTWNIFNGFKTKAQVQENTSKLISIQEQLNQQKLVISQEVTNAYINVKEQEESLTVSLNKLQLSQENLNLAQARYKNGLNDIVELNDARLTYTQSKTDLVTTYYDYQTSLANLEYTTGIIYKVMLK